MKLTKLEQSIKNKEKKIVSDYHKHSVTDIEAVKLKVQSMIKKAQHDQEA